MDGDTIERLQAIFRAALGLGTERDACSLHRADVDEWDSLAHVLLVAGIENEFGLTVDLADSLRIDSFEAALALLREVPAHAVP